MATTTNYGWTTPDDTALVKDGASAIRSLGSAIDSTLKTQIDAQIADSIVDAKGDLISATAADTPARLAVGTNGQVLTADSTQSTGLKWSTPATGFTWTHREANKITMQEIAYDGSSLYVAVGSSGTLYTSTNGTTWTSRTSGFGANDIFGVGYGNGLWVAVGTNGTITTSPDGITWTARTSNMSTNDIMAVTYANSVWVAVGGGGGSTNTGGITYSTDGITWTRKSQTLTVGARYYDAAWNGTNWIVVADSSTNNYLYASTPSGTWTAGATGSAGSVYFIAWDGTRNLTIEGTAYVSRYSTSTTLGTTTTYTNGHQGEQAYSGAYFYYNNLLYISNTRYFGSLVPATSATTTVYPGQLLPMITRSTTPFINSHAGAIFVGAIGIIWASQYGIFTSF